VTFTEPLLEKPEPDDSENDDDGEYRPYFAWNPPWSEYDAADQVGSGEN
jgi:hypothetical protein